jgi:hypothetical protein
MGVKVVLRDCLAQSKNRNIESTDIYEQVAGPSWHHFFARKTCNNVVRMAKIIFFKVARNEALENYI